MSVGRVGNPVERRAAFERHKGLCHWCTVLTHLDSVKDSTQATQDHVHPRHSGGADVPANIVNACASCNSRRNYEDTKGLPEGALLKFWPGPPKPYSVMDSAKKHADYRKAEQRLREQKDQAMKRVFTLQAELSALNLELSESAVYADKLYRELESITVWRLVRAEVTVWRDLVFNRFLAASFVSFMFAVVVARL